MKLGTRSAVLTTALALVASPAALASNPPGKDQPGPTASMPAKAKAYGRYCQGQSKEHVKGEKGTRFSQCVTAMAKLASGATSSPKTACSAMTKARQGRKASPFSTCVEAGTKLLKDRKQQSQPSQPTLTLTK